MSAHRDKVWLTDEEWEELGSKVWQATARLGRAKNQRFINHFNNNHPPGSQVLIQYNGSEQIVTVASLAFLESGRVCCVFVEIPDPITIAIEPDEEPYNTIPNGRRLPTH